MQVTAHEYTLRTLFQTHKKNATTPFILLSNRHSATSSIVAVQAINLIFSLYPPRHDGATAHGGAWVCLQKAMWLAVCISFYQAHRRYDKTMCMWLHLALLSYFFQKTKCRTFSSPSFLLHLFQIIISLTFLSYFLPLSYLKNVQSHTIFMAFFINKNC